MTLICKKLKFKLSYRLNLNLYNINFKMTGLTLQNVVKCAADLDTTYGLAIVSGVVYEMCENVQLTKFNKNLLIEHPLSTVWNGLMSGAGMCAGVWVMSKVFGNSTPVNTVMSGALGIASVGYVVRAGGALLKNKKSADKITGE